MRLVHLADLHLGYRAYHRVTSSGMNRREADIFQAFKEALDLTAELQPNLVLLAGDIFHVPRPTNSAVIQTQKLLLAFRQKCDAEIVAIAGNHESVRSADNRCILELLALIDGVQVVTSQPEIISVAGDRLKVTCLPHNSLIQGDQVQAVRPLADAEFNILMLHGTVDSDRINDYGGYEVPRDILAMPWDYVACGHYHTHTHLGKNAYYAGAIERTSNDIWKEANDQKGLIEFDLASHTAKFHALRSPRPTIDLPVIDASQKEAAEIDRLIAKQASAVDITDKIVRQQVINLAKSVQRQLNHRQIRLYQNQAVHYLFDPRSAESKVFGSDRSEELSEKIAGEVNGQPGGLLEDAKDFLGRRALPTGLLRDQFVSKGLSYLQTGD